MNAVDAIEARRLAAQRELDAAKTQDERNRLGQFATPPGLAEDMLRHASALLPEQEPVQFLDPAFGTGSFYTALLRVFGNRVSAAAGFEIDPHYGEIAVELWKDHPVDLRVEDFTVQESPDERFNLIICNPPYVRHHHIELAQKWRLQSKASMLCGVRIAGLAGLYCYFLGLSHAWLADDGIAGWLVPSEFMDVNYGTPTRLFNAAGWAEVSPRCNTGWAK